MFVWLRSEKKMKRPRHSVLYPVTHMCATRRANLNRLLKIRMLDCPIPFLLEDFGSSIIIIFSRYFVIIIMSSVV